MKIRIGFISNSSSSSFILPLKAITELQVNQLLNYYDVIASMPKSEETEYLDHYWEISLNDDAIEGTTIMNNVDMHWFMEQIGINPKLAKWEDS